MIENNRREELINTLKEIISSGVLDEDTCYNKIDDIKNTSKGILAGALIGGIAGATGGDLSFYHIDKKKQKKNSNYESLKLEQEERNKQIEETKQALEIEKEERKKQIEETKQALEIEKEERKKQIEELKEEEIKTLRDIEKQIENYQNMASIMEKKMFAAEKKCSNKIDTLESFNVVSNDGVNKEIKIERTIIPGKEEKCTRNLKVTKRISMQKPNEKDEIKDIDIYNQYKLFDLLETDIDFADKKEEFKDLHNLYMAYLSSKNEYDTLLNEIERLTREKKTTSFSYNEKILNLSNKPYKAQEALMELTCYKIPNGTKCPKPFENQKVLDTLYNQSFENQKALDEAKKYKPNIGILSSIPILSSAVGGVIGGINRHKKYISSCNKHYKPSFNFGLNAITEHSLLLPLDNKPIEINNQYITSARTKQARDVLMREGRSFIEIDSLFDEIYVIGDNEKAQKIRQLLNINNEENVLTKDNDNYKLLSAALYSFIPNDLNEDKKEIENNKDYNKKSRIFKKNIKYIKKFLNEDDKKTILSTENKNQKKSKNNIKYKIVKDYLGEVIKDNNIDKKQENTTSNIITNTEEIDSNISNIDKQEHKLTLKENKTTSNIITNTEEIDSNISNNITSSERNNMNNHVNILQNQNQFVTLNNTATNINKDNNDHNKNRKCEIF